MLHLFRESPEIFAMRAILQLLQRMRCNAKTSNQIVEAETSNNGVEWVSMVQVPPVTTIDDFGHEWRHRH
jgi:hypothetical protein